MVMQESQTAKIYFQAKFDRGSICNKKANNAAPQTYGIIGPFYEQKTQKTEQNDFRIEKLIKFKCKDYDELFNKYINNNYIRNQYIMNCKNKKQNKTKQKK